MPGTEYSGLKKFTERLQGWTNNRDPYSAWVSAQRPDGYKWAAWLLREDHCRAEGQAAKGWQRLLSGGLKEL